MWQQCHLLASRVPMDVQALEQAALAAVAAAGSTDAIEAVRVEYLGRKSALKLALREVRDRETGMTPQRRARADRGGRRRRATRARRAPSSTAACARSAST